MVDVFISTCWEHSLVKLPNEARRMATLATCVVSRHQDKRSRQQTDMIKERKGELDGTSSALKPSEGTRHKTNCDRTAL